MSLHRTGFIFSSKRGSKKETQRSFNTDEKKPVQAWCRGRTWRELRSLCLLRKPRKRHASAGRPRGYCSRQGSPQTGLACDPLPLCWCWESGSSKRSPTQGTWSPVTCGDSSVHVRRCHGHVCPHEGLPSLFPVLRRTRGCGPGRGLVPGSTPLTCKMTLQNTPPGLYLDSQPEEAGAEKLPVTSALFQTQRKDISSNMCCVSRVNSR